jgi:group II intron reverse transcriptase/maturase
MSRSLFERAASLSSLGRAFDEELRRDGPAGIDRKRPSQLQEQRDSLLRKLHDELHKGRYVCQPVVRHRIPKKKGGTRPIGIATVRDRVVQRSLLRVLAPVFERLFLDGSHAFRPRRSPQTALRQVEQYRDAGFHWVFEADIEDCFGSVDDALFADELLDICGEGRLIDVLLPILRSGVMEGGFVNRAERGLPQGSPLSPLLANTYLHPFDVAMTQKGYRLVRYADDFVVLCQTEEETERAGTDVEWLLAQRAMRLAPEKTCSLHISEGLAFLGCVLTIDGMAAKPKAIQTLQRRLRSCHALHQHATAQERFAALYQIVQGWRQYYPHFGAFQFDHPEIARVVLRVATTHGETDTVARCQAYLQGNPQAFVQPIWEQSPVVQGAIEMRQDDTAFSNERARRADISPLAAEVALFRHKLHHEPRNTQYAHHLASLYLHCETPVQSHAVLEHSLRATSSTETLFVSWTPEGPSVSLSEREKQQFLSWFAGRSMLHSRAVSLRDGRMRYEPQTGAIGPVLLQEHLQGRGYLGSFLADDAGHTRVAGLSINLTKVALQRHLGVRDSQTQNKERIHQWAIQCISYCEQLGIMGLLEDTGSLERRLWFIWEEAVPVTSIAGFFNTILQAIPAPPEGVTAEAFPSAEQPDASVPLPLGGHIKTGRRSLLLHPIDGTPIPVSQAFSYVLPIRASLAQSLWKRQARIENQSDISLRYPLVERLASSCLVLRKLIDKLVATHDLTYMERVSMLYTFGYLGEEGRLFLHDAMSLCAGYKEKETSRWIAKRRDFPISCQRLREKHDDLLGGTSCQCLFKRIPPRRYATPLLHVLPIREVFPKEPRKKGRSQKQSGSVEVVQRNRPVSRVSDKSEELIRKGLELHKQQQGVNAAMERHKELLRMLMKEEASSCLRSKKGSIMCTLEEDGQEKWIFSPDGMVPSKGEH